MSDIKMSKADYNAYAKIRGQRRLSAEASKLIATLHSKYFHHQYYVPCSCADSTKTWQGWIAQLNTIWDNGHS